MSLFLIGALAGLGVAMPLGAIGVLLLREGLISGFRTAAAGAAAVGLVDTAYCVLAVTIGSLAEASIERFGALPALVSGAILVAIGASNLVRVASPAPFQPSPAVARSWIGIFLRFAGLTAVNPATLLYFVALAATLSASLGLDEHVVGFVAGVGIASTGWQLGLVAVGAFLGGRLGPSGQRRLGVVGSSIVLALGVAALAAGTAQLLGS